MLVYVAEGWMNGAPVVLGIFSTFKAAHDECMNNRFYGITAILTWKLDETSYKEDYVVRKMAS